MRAMILVALAGSWAGAIAALAMQDQFRYQYPRWRGEDEYVEPAVAGAPKHEFSFARAMYRGEGRRGNRSWTTDWPKADRQFLMGVKRLSRLDSGAEPVSLHWSDSRVFQYPFLYAVEVGYLTLDDQEARRLREYLDRGGFLMVDDFHGDYEWAHFEHEIRKVFPDRPIEELEMDDPIFHCLFDVNEKIQVPVVRYIETGITYEKGGYVPHHRGIRDDKGRIVVMINYNMDLGDAWEWADLPEYPEKFSGQAYRLGLNYIIHAMTH